MPMPVVVNSDKLAEDVLRLIQQRTKKKKRFAGGYGNRTTKAFGLIYSQMVDSGNIGRKLFFVTLRLFNLLGRVWHSSLSMVACWTRRRMRESPRSCWNASSPACAPILSLLCSSMAQTGTIHY